MIDYEKLKLIEELMSKIDDAECYFTTNISVADSHMFRLSHDKHGDQYHRYESFTNMDDLITKLQELLHPEPKYKETWYIINHNQVKSTKVWNKEGYACCDETHPEAVGRHMYPTKQDLLEAQLSYWSKLYEEENPGTLVMCKRAPPRWNRLLKTFEELNE